MVSVIIPTYKRQDFTARAVRSVLAQTYRDLEVLVVDDCSPEPITAAALGNDPCLRVIRHETNRGVGAARNTGVEAARGDVVAFLDSDDYWLPEKLQQQMAIYERQPDQDRAVVYCTYYYELEGKWLKDPYDSIGEREAVSDYIFVRLGEILTSTWLGSRRLFAENSFCTELLRHQDGDLLLRLGEKGIRFLHSLPPAAVRCADLRPDRLSTAAVPAMRKLFLDRNVERMTPRAAALTEVAYEMLFFPQESFVRRQIRQLAHIGQTSRLNAVQKVTAIYCYIKFRVKIRLRQRLIHQPPQLLDI